MRNIIMIVLFLCLVCQLLPAFADPLDQRPDFITSSPLRKSETLDAGDIVECFGSSLDKLSSPCVVWLDPAVKSNLEFKISGRRSYRKWLERYSKDLGKFHEIAHPAFIELTWGSDEKIKELRVRMKQEVPPISFVVKEASQVLEMWSRISGIKISYKKSESGPPGEGSHSGQMEIFKEFEFYKESEELRAHIGNPALVFTFNAPTNLDEFISLIAAQVGCVAVCEEGVWNFTPFTETNVSADLVRKLLAQIEEDSTSPGYGNPGQILVRIGKPALREILKEFPNASDYYYDSLADILATIPDPARDEAFMRELEKSLSNPDTLLAHWYVPTMMNALVENKCWRAVAILEKFAKGDNLGGLSGDAMIALNNLGSPIWTESLGDRTDLSGESDEWTSLPDYQKMRAILLSIADYGPLFGGQRRLKVSSVMENEVGALTFKGTFLKEKGEWKLEIGRDHEGKVPVYHDYICGGLCGVGSSGILKKEDDRWLIISWQMCWIS